MAPEQGQGQGQGQGQELGLGLGLGPQGGQWKLNGTMDELGWVGLPYWRGIMQSGSESLNYN